MSNKNKYKYGKYEFTFEFKSGNSETFVINLYDYDIDERDWYKLDYPEREQIIDDIQQELLDDLLYLKTWKYIGE